MHCQEYQLCPITLPSLVFDKHFPSLKILFQSITTECLLAIGGCGKLQILTDLMRRVKMDFFVQK